MRLGDVQYTLPSHDGVRRIAAWLRSQSCHVRPTRVAWLMHLMGTAVLSPTPQKSELHPVQWGYLSLLRGVPITRVQQVWYTDITDIRWPNGLLALVAVMAGRSRHVLSWTVSIMYGLGLGSGADRRI